MTAQSARSSDNPLLRREGLPPFGDISPGHIVPAVEKTLADRERQLEELERSLVPTWEGLVEPLMLLGLGLEYGWRPVRHLLNVKNSDALREAHEAMLPKVVASDLRLQQSRPIYEGLVALKKGAEWDGLSEAQKRVVDLRIRDAEHAGVGLTGNAKERFIEIEKELSQLATTFQNHVLDSKKAYALVIADEADTEGWPQTLKAISAQSYNQTKSEGDPDATPESGPWRITLDFPSFYPFMQHSRNTGQRKKVYLAYITVASSGEWDNSDLIARILKLRKEKVALLGFETYADFSLDAKMAPSVAAVERMFDDLSTPSKPCAVGDFEELQALAKESGVDEPLKHWDLAFWAERLREKRFDYTDEQLRPYFPMPRVLDGLFALTTRLFGVTVEQSRDDVSVWHPDVRYFVVRDERGGQISSFYLDAYTRPAEKRGGAWMDDCLARRIVGGELRLPVVHVTCNGTPPVGDRPSLMSFGEVETLFHEFGHALQGMLTTVDYSDVAGTNGVEWDAIELASQFMENWCYHKPTLLGMTAHVDTGEPLPDDLFEKIRAARTFRAGSNMMRQLEFGITDMHLHHEFDPDGEETAFDVHRRVAEETSVLPPVDENRFLCAFNHIFAGPYAAGYYSYKWAEVLSADAFGAFEEAGLDDESAVHDLGRRFRDTVLAEGGGRHPMDVFRDFRGREPSTEALLRQNGLLD